MDQEAYPPFRRMTMNVLDSIFNWLRVVQDLQSLDRLGEWWKCVHCWEHMMQHTVLECTTGEEERRDGKWAWSGCECRKCDTDVVGEQEKLEDCSWVYQKCGEILRKRKRIRMVLLNSFKINNKKSFSLYITCLSFYSFSGKRCFLTVVWRWNLY